MKTENQQIPRERVSNRVCLTHYKDGSQMSVMVIGINSLPFCTICHGEPIGVNGKDDGGESMELHLDEARHVAEQLREYIAIREAYLAASGTQGDLGYRVEIINYDREAEQAIPQEMPDDVFEAMMTEMAFTLSPVYQDIEDERERQDAQWGGPEHDDQHSYWDWLDYIERQSVRCQTAGLARNIPEMRARLIKIAALSVAAVQSLDRKQAEQARIWQTSGNQGDEEAEIMASIAPEGGEEG